MRVPFGEFTFDGVVRELRRRGETVHLTPKAFDLLAILIRERPRAVSKDELREALWPDVVVGEANLKNLVVEIRGVLGRDAVRTVHRFGYAFVPSIASAVSARLVASNRVHPLAPGSNVIGREDSCEVILLAAGVSRKHATIDVSASGATLTDLGSKNGTWVNDARVDGQRDLQDGDRIRIGGLTMTFRATSTDSTATMDDA